MPLSPLYLEKLQAAQQAGEQIGEQRGEINGRKDFVLRLLNKRVGVVSADLLAKVMELSLDRLENLYDAALDFTKVSDLTAWFEQNW